MTQPDAQKARGLPMTSKWDPEKLKQEEQFLQKLEGASWPTRIRGYFKLTGPAWLQSAMTSGRGQRGGFGGGRGIVWLHPALGATGGDAAGCGDDGGVGKRGADNRRAALPIIRP
jgi:hypothetical protein